MADLETSIAIRILDMFTGPLRALKTGLAGVEDVAKRAEKHFAVAADLNQAAEAAGRFGQMMIGPVRAAVDEFRGFDHALSRLSSMSEQARGSGGFEALKTQAESLGASTQYSATEVAQLQTELAQAGFTLQEILGASEQTLSAASAAGLGLGETAGIVAGALRSMKLDVSEVARVTDVMSVASVKSGADMRGLSDALSYVGPDAAAAGMSLEMTIAMIGKLSDAQIKGSQAGTGLRAVLKSLEDPSSDAKKALAGLGMEGPKLRQMQKDVAAGRLADVLKQIGEASAQLPDAKRLELISRVFGREASASAQVLISTSMTGGGLKALYDQVQNVDGATLKMAHVMEDDLQGAIERAGGAISALKTNIGEGLAPAVKDGSKVIEGMAGWLGTFAKKNPEFVSATTELMVGVGALAFVMKGALLTHAAYATAVAYASKAAAAGIMGPLGLVVAAGAAGVALGLWANAAFDLTERLMKYVGMAKATETKDKANKDVRTYAGGWEINERTGAVLKRGTGPEPAQVKRAREVAFSVGADPEALSDAELGAIIGRERNARAGQTMTSRARDTGALLSPLAAPALESDALAASAATKEQTVLLLETLRRQEAHQKVTADELRRIGLQRQYLNLGLGYVGVP